MIEKLEPGVDYPEDLSAQSVCNFANGWRAIQRHVSARERCSFPDRRAENYNVAEKIALVHSELSEALEAYRKDLMDDHIPERAGIEVEFADVVIRLMGIADNLGLDLPSAIFAKAVYNDTRADHKPENRKGKYGKRF